MLCTYCYFINVWGLFFWVLFVNLFVVVTSLIFLDCFSGFCLFVCGLVTVFSIMFHFLSLV